MSYTTTKYNTESFPFVDLIKELLGSDNLELIDEFHEEKFKVGADSKTAFHDLFYAKYRNGWEAMHKLYEEFVSSVIAPNINEDFLYQKFPTFRVHLNSNVAVGDFHTDSEFGHPIGEINYVIPLTDSKGTASIWVECTKGKEDYVDMDMRVGELIQFNGNQLRHGNLVNETGKTRVSMDFRILPISMYNPEVVSESMTKKTKFIEGEYYLRFNK